MTERKYLAHYIDAAFDSTHNATDYIRLGKDLEEYSVELNPDVETRKNILGENSVSVNGYEVSSSVDPYYYDYDEALSEKIMDIAMNRTTGDGCKTTTIDVLLKPGASADASPSVVWAYREDCYIVPQSVGGDTSGIQIPFELHRAGNRVKGNFDLSTKKFTEGGL
ncbi:MAG: hypothetical protein J6Q92_05240 [Oscillospiraceae bacterium]|nr:hypothetical protein [Oscillospiraceae bacterium]